MKRLLLIPVCLICACSITVTPLGKPSKRIKHRSHKSSQRAKKPTPTPAPDTTPIVDQVHEQYEPIYEKLPPKPKEY